MCMATQSDILTKVYYNLFNINDIYVYFYLKFNSSCFTLRHMQQHMTYLELMEGERGKDRQYHSTTSGINGRSSLLSLVGFDITKCLPYDIMHTVFEGVAFKHIKLLFAHLIEGKRYLTLDQLILAIRNHKYGYSEGNTKPSHIGKDSTSLHIKQSGNYINLYNYSCTENYYTIPLH